jgi:hypothetical protein
MRSFRWALISVVAVMAAACAGREPPREEGVDTVPRPQVAAPATPDSLTGDSLMARDTARIP